VGGDKDVLDQYASQNPSCLRESGVPLPSFPVRTAETYLYFYSKVLPYVFGLGIRYEKVSILANYWQ